MGRAERVEDVFPRAGAGIDKAAGSQAFQCSAVMVKSLALIVGPERSAAVGTFLPAKPEPAQVVGHGVNELRFAAGAVEVFIAQHQGAAGLLCALLRRPEGSRVAEMKVARGRGSKATPIAAWADGSHSGSSTLQATDCRTKSNSQGPNPKEVPNSKVQL